MGRRRRPRRLRPTRAAVRRVLDHGGDHASPAAAINSIASQIGGTAEPLRRWARQAPRGTGGSAPVRPRPSVSVSAWRRWSGRAAICPWPTRSCARRRPVLPDRRPTAARSRDRVPRRTPRGPEGEPICLAPPLAPSPCHGHPARRADPAKASARTRQDAVLPAAIRRVFDANLGVCGVRKVRRQLRHAANGPARRRAQGGHPDDGARQGDAASGRAGEPAVPAAMPERPPGAGLHRRRDLAGLRPHRLRRRRPRLPGHGRHRAVHGQASATASRPWKRSAPSAIQPPPGSRPCPPDPAARSAPGGPIRQGSSSRSSTTQWDTTASLPHTGLLAPDLADRGRAAPAGAGPLSPP